jgi:hypothetical protein
MTDFPTEDLLTPKPIPPERRKPISANANPDLVRRFEEAADRLGLNKDQALEQMLTQWLAGLPHPASAARPAARNDTAVCDDRTVDGCSL